MFLSLVQYGLDRITVWFVLLDQYHSVRISDKRLTPKHYQVTNKMSESIPSKPIKDESIPANALEETKVVLEAEKPEEKPEEALVEETPLKTVDEEHADDDTGKEVVEEDEVEPEPVYKPIKKVLTGKKDILVRKVIVNITTGASGEPLEKAMTLLHNITGQRSTARRAKQTIRNWGIRKGEPISCLVTLRGDSAMDFLKKGFNAVRNRINPKSFDRNGNFAFGIKEHIDIAGQRYDPNLGIIGMDVMVNLERQGYRVNRRRRARARVGHSHRITKEEAMEYVKNSFGVKVAVPVER